VVWQPVTIRLSPTVVMETRDEKEAKEGANAQAPSGPLQEW
jgi:hypothetical protein